MKIIHIPFHFDLGSLGGTEIYTHALCRELVSLGHDCMIAAPSLVASNFKYAGICVETFSFSEMDPFNAAYGKPDGKAFEEFRRILNRWRPQIVHLHARSAAVSCLFTKAAREIGAVTVYTYHTPTGSCPRGTMMHLGIHPCDGRLTSRCVACVLQSKGASAALGHILANFPGIAGSFGEAAAAIGMEGPAVTALRVSGRVSQSRSGLMRFLSGFDAVVAVCDWVAEVLRRNGVSEARLTVSRQGLPVPPPAPPPAPRVRDGGAVRIGFFGRLDKVKGVETLLDALARAPSLPVELRIFGVRQRGGDAYADGLAARAASDPRARIEPPAPPDAVVARMAECDVIAIPSVWLETGPLVALEAFAAGRPVLGSNLGGLAELVSHERDGLLAPAGDSAAWADALTRLVDEPGLLGRLTAGVRPPRLMADAAADMAALYDALLRAPRTRDATA